MVTLPYGPHQPSLVSARCAPRKAVREASSPHEPTSRLARSTLSAPTSEHVSQGDGARCTRIMHMWTRAHERDGCVTSVLHLYLVERVRSHGEERHFVSMDAGGWRCTASEQCGAVAVAKAEHERAERVEGGHHDRHEAGL